MADYLTARAAIAAKLAAVSIATPVVTTIAQVDETGGDGGDATMKAPAVRITGYSVRYRRGPSSQRERTYTIGLRLMVRPIAGATMRATLEALKEAISEKFDGAVTLGLGAGYHIVEGPNWIRNEPESDGGSVWDEGEIVLSIKDTVSFTA